MRFDIMAPMSELQSPSVAPASVRRKSVAIGSGKGGVGKSTTAVNLAIQYARSGLRVALIDLDPLSNTAVILDISESELGRVRATFDRDDDTLSDHVFTVFKNLELVFPHAKTKKNASHAMRERLYGRFAGEIDDRYDIILLDLPAGIGAEENLSFLPSVGSLLVVTNPEPTAHVSSGGYIKAAFEIVPSINVFLWHNKYVPAGEHGFDTRDVVGNYNRHVSDDLKISAAEKKRVVDLAFIPHDAALDLLQQTVSYTVNVQARMREIVELLLERRLANIAFAPTVSERLRQLIRFYVRRNRDVAPSAEYVARIETFIGDVVRSASGKPVRVSLSGRTDITAYLDAVHVDPFVRDLTVTHRVLTESIEKSANTSRMFSAAGGVFSSRNLDAALIRVMRRVAATPKLATPENRNLAGLLVFYYALFKLGSSKAVTSLVTDFIPTRKTRNGTRRDTRTQIRLLVEKDERYHQRYFAMVRALFPVVRTQLGKIVTTFGLNALILRNAEKKTNSNAYLKLLTNFLHDTVNSGLGVFVGFAFNAASAAMRDGADRLSRIVRQK